MIVKGKFRAVSPQDPFTYISYMYKRMCGL